MPRHPGHRLPPPPGPGRLLPPAQAAPVSIYPRPGPARPMQRAPGHWPGPAGHHPGDPAAL